MCDICSSDLLSEINKKRNWRPDRVVNWANRRGLKITEDDLSNHFAEHAPKSEKKPKKKSPKKTVSDKKNGLAIKTEANADSAFLDEVVRRVFEELAESKYSLKLEHGFKAIEIKQKIADKTDVENLLLELLNEIRQQELA